MRAIIFANTELHDPNAARKIIRSDDVLIAADGGARHCLALGLTPTVVIGDFDSLSEEEQSQLESAGAQFIRHPARKDETDLELALLHAKSLEAAEVIVLAGLGARWDQSLANLLLPAHPHLEGVEITFIDGNQHIYTIYDQRRISGNPGDTVSLLPIGGDVTGVITMNLEYPLSDETLFFGTTRGVSNVLIENEASITIKSGILLCVLIQNSKGNANE